MPVHPFRDYSQDSRKAGQASRLDSARTSACATDCSGSFEPPGFVSRSTAMVRRLPGLKPALQGGAEAILRAKCTKSEPRPKRPEGPRRERIHKPAPRPQGTVEKCSSRRTATVSERPHTTHHRHNPALQGWDANAPDNPATAPISFTKFADSVTTCRTIAIPTPSRPAQGRRSGHPCYR